MIALSHTINYVVMFFVAGGVGALGGLGLSSCSSGAKTPAALNWRIVSRALSSSISGPADTYPGREPRCDRTTPSKAATGLRRTPFGPCRAPLCGFVSGTAANLGSCVACGSRAYAPDWDRSVPRWSSPRATERSCIPCLWCSFREELTRTLKELTPESAVAPRLEVLRKACREYLDAPAKLGDASTPTDFAPALSQLRASFYEIADWVASRYELPAARALVEDMGIKAEASRDHAASSPIRRASEDDQEKGTPDEPVSALTDGKGPIVTALADRDSRVRLNAMIALRSRLTPELLPIIEPLLNDRDDTIRAYAVDYYADLAP
jgi:hypothetical protein